VGLVIVLPAAVASDCIAALEAAGEHAWVIGHVQQRGTNPAIEFTGELG
ncbi:MAG: phosphoribosylformylglycinamidine cyclo-ligase, partial [Pseudomonadales bacterium]|nr:phosphoribosylformylglycinamidine cyclo-ligase [Pseudomonadales bacterium]